MQQSFTEHGKYKTIMKWKLREVESTIFTSENYCCQTYASHNLCKHYGNILHVLCTSASHLKPTLNVIFTGRLPHNYSVTTITSLYGARNLFLFTSYNGQDHLGQWFWIGDACAPREYVKPHKWKLETQFTVHTLSKDQQKHPDNCKRQSKAIPVTGREGP
jgi:hypothetical protein